MLTISKIKKIYRHGIDVRFRRSPHPLGWKGEYLGSTLDVIVYLPALESKRDLDLTLLHEFVHADDDISSSRLPNLSDDEDDERAESEAIEAYERRPKVLEFIKQLYNIERRIKQNSKFLDY